MLAKQALEAVNTCYWMELVTGERNAQKNENNVVSGAIDCRAIYNGLITSSYTFCKTVSITFYTGSKLGVNSVIFSSIYL